MKIRQFGEIPWYVVAVHYPSALMAKSAWERAERKLNQVSGDKGIGVMRLSPAAPGPNVAASGAPPGVHPVVAVTLDEATARKAERILHGGTSWEPTDGFADALIARRARVVLQHGREQTGRMVIRRPEGRGATLRGDGELSEPDPPKG